MSLLDRLNQLENKIINVQGFVQETTDRVFTENIAINDRLNKHFSYSSVAQSKTSLNPAANVLEAKKPVNIESHSKVGGMTHPPPVQRHKDLSTQNKIDDQFQLPPPVKTPPKSFGHNKTPDVDCTSLAESAGFQFPKHRKRAIIVGKDKKVGAIKGAPQPNRDIFIYRVEKSTNERVSMII